MLGPDLGPLEEQEANWLYQLSHVPAQSFFVEAWSQYVSKADLELEAILPQPLESKAYEHELPNMASPGIFFSSL